MDYKVIIIPPYPGLHIPEGMKDLIALAWEHLDASVIAEEEKLRDDLLSGKIDLETKDRLIGNQCCFPSNTEYIVVPSAYYNRFFGKVHFIMKLDEDGFRRLGCGTSSQDQMLKIYHEKDLQDTIVRKFSSIASLCSYFSWLVEISTHKRDIDKYWNPDKYYTYLEDWGRPDPEEYW